MKKIQATAKGNTAQDFGLVERNDCAVRALSNASGMTYLEAHTLLRKNGRQNQSGTKFDTLQQSYTCAGFELVGVYGNTRAATYVAWNTGKEPQQGITLGKILPKLNKGKYIVIVTGHAVAVKDGEIIDTFDNKEMIRVIAVYQNRKV